MIWSKTNLKDGYKGFVPQETVTEQNKEGLNIWNSLGLNILKKKLLTFMRPLANTIFMCHDRKEIKFLITLRRVVTFVYIELKIAFKILFFQCSSVHYLLLYSNKRLTFLTVKLPKIVIFKSFKFSFKTNVLSIKALSTLKRINHCQMLHFSSF